MNRDIGKIIERHIEREQWKTARRVIRRGLTKEPDDHWLWARLALTHYEEHRYTKALELDEKALKLMPRCPLVLWGYAGSLDMLGREKEAIVVWKRLLRRGVKSLAFGECGEGLRWAYSLVNDCRYRIGCSYEDLGNLSLARKYVREHLAHRKRGMTSSYTMRDVKKVLKQFTRD